MTDPTDAPDPTQGARPTFTLTGAAEATGRSRRTIGRMLDAEELPGATRTAAGTWSIPTEALLAAGLTLHAPTPPDPAPAPPEAEKASTPTESENSAELDEVRAELADWRRRAEVAEAIAAERAAALDDVRKALDLASRQLTPETARTPDPPPTPSYGETRSEPRRRWWHRRPRP